MSVFGLRDPRWLTEGVGVDRRRAITVTHEPPERLSPPMSAAQTALGGGPDRVKNLPVVHAGVNRRVRQLLRGADVRRRDVRRHARARIARDEFVQVSGTTSSYEIDFDRDVSQCAYSVPSFADNSTPIVELRIFPWTRCTFVPPPTEPSPRIAPTCRALLNRSPRRLVPHKQIRELDGATVLSAGLTARWDRPAEGQHRAYAARRRLARRTLTLRN